MRRRVGGLGVWDVGGLAQLVVRFGQDDRWVGIELGEDGERWGEVRWERDKGEKWGERGKGGRVRAWGSTTKNTRKDSGNLECKSITRNPSRNQLQVATAQVTHTSVRNRIIQYLLRKNRQGKIHHADAAHPVDGNRVETLGIQPVCMGVLF